MDTQDYKSFQIIKSYGDLIKINVSLRNQSSYQVVFYVLGKKKSISFNKNETEAHRIAKAISYDLDTGNLTLDDIKPLSGKDILALYQQQNKTKLTIIQSLQNIKVEMDIKQIWEEYKIIAINKVAKSTQAISWHNTDNLLSKLSEEERKLSNLDKLANHCLKYYSISTVRRCFEDLQSALNVIVNKKPLGSTKALQSDFCLVDKLPKKQKAKIQYYKPDEVNEILQAFKDSESSYYYNYLFFCAMTGVRPSEAVALRVPDIKVSQQKVQVVINKAFSGNVLNFHTKNYKIRIIPCNQKLADFLIDYLANHEEDLFFPSKSGSFMDKVKFNRRHFKPIVLELVEKGKVEQYLRPYCLRHSFATNMLRKGVDIATVAGLLGDTIQTVIDNYIGSDYENADLPDIY